MVLRPDRGRRHEVPNLGSPTRRPRQRSMCGVMGSPSHTVFDPHRGRINGKCHTRPRGVDPYGVLTPGYQDLTALRSLAPIGAYSVRSICLTRSLAPFGAFVLASAQSTTCAYLLTDNRRRGSDQKLFFGRTLAPILPHISRKRDTDRFLRQCRKNFSRT